MPKIVGQPPRLTTFQQKNKVTDAGLASMLTDRLGEPVTEDQVKKMKQRGDRSLKKAWAEALELPELSAIRDDDVDAPEPSPDAPAAPKTKAPAVVPDELDWRNAREAIIAMYRAVGTGLSMVMKRPDIATTFNNGAVILADDWIKLARVDDRVRALLAKLTVAGPSGALVMDHLILVTTIISSGRSTGGGIFVPGPGPVTGTDGLGADGAMAGAGTTPPV